MTDDVHGVLTDGAGGAVDETLAALVALAACHDGGDDGDAEEGQKEGQDCVDDDLEGVHGYFSELRLMEAMWQMGNDGRQKTAKGSPPRSTGGWHVPAVGEMGV